VAANKAVAKAISEVLTARNGHEPEVSVPKDYLYIEAIGSALLSAGKTATVTRLPRPNGQQRYFTMPALEKISLPPSLSANGQKLPASGYLGIDVGSTSTKAVIIDLAGTVVAKSYLMTAGRPLDALKEVFQNLVKDTGNKISIAGAAVTGSGRYLAGGFIGADLIKDEITAQARAAAEIEPEADIIEIGGQDSKLIIKRKGIVADYQMNKACAAGTGSFIDELAEMLGISVKNGDFARLAFTAPNTIDLGARCAAFTGQAVAAAQQEGVSLPVITASLANSIAENYLSKVVAHRKLGSKIILTGAVFYNEAVVAAFRRQLGDKTVAVAGHREVSGAIGAALLARESVSAPSCFRGLRDVIAADYTLTTFTCQRCDNNCTITRMKLSDGTAVYYGSRCDRYGISVEKVKEKTFFDKREKLLFHEYRENAAGSPVVGVPRALLVYDYAPLLLGFLSSLGAKVVLSSQTTKEITEEASQLSYSDSCFPLKLLHGHAAHLTEVDYILYPCAVRLGLKEGEENQKYTCPLVQASPYIIRQALKLDKKLLAPIMDLSRGEAETTASLAETAVEMGFTRSQGKRAARTGLAAQRHFEAERATLGSKLLAELKRSGKLGVVLFSRSYMSQDAGANLGIVEMLARLGVVPVPLDFLPLDSVDARLYSDRPYWAAESKHISGAHITATEPNLFGLVLTNFGCGPNSFILKIVEDIMGDKPLGQLEIDEHAAEAGIVTRLEAFVSTIKSYAASGQKDSVQSNHIYRGVSQGNGLRKTLIAPNMAPQIEAGAAAMNAYGVDISVLPESDERSLLFANQVTSGAECLPFRVTLGDFIRFFHDNGPGLKEMEGFTGGAYGPCRFGKYAIEQERLLREIGFKLPIRTTVSNNAYSDLGLGSGFERLAWKGVVAVDCLDRLLWRCRPYEKEAGAADRLYNKYLGLICERIRRHERFGDLLHKATADFHALIDPSLPRRPVVGINGEIYLRSNRFSNNDLCRVCEDTGLEVSVSPIGEWLNYTSHRNLEDALRDRKFKKIVAGLIRKMIQGRDERAVLSSCIELLEDHEPSVAELTARTSQYLSPRCGGEAVLSIGSGLRWLQESKIAGVISVMPHGCMPGGIVAAMSEDLGSTFGKPWISLTYDGFAESNNLARINNFAEVIRFCRQSQEA
jgi:predicted CoA-substrate-specific enzyme activase